MCCLVNVYAYNCIALGVPIFIRGSPKSYENGDPGVPNENRDPGPHFSMRMGTWGPQFGGSLFSYDTGIYPSQKAPSLFPRMRSVACNYTYTCENKLSEIHTLSRLLNGGRHSLNLVWGYTWTLPPFFRQERV